MTRGQSNLAKSALSVLFSGQNSTPTLPRILGIHCCEFFINEEVATLSQLLSINEAISRRRHSLFGHVRRMDQAAPAHQALHLSVTSRHGSGGRPRKCWVEQVTTSTGLSTDAWSVATDWSAWRVLRPVDGQERETPPSRCGWSEASCNTLCLGVSRGLTSHSTLYRSFWGRFLQVR